VPFLAIVYKGETEEKDKDDTLDYINRLRDARENVMDSPEHIGFDN
jgi:hypothetical protein